MNEWIAMTGGFLAGAAAGAFFVASLWWTTVRLPASRQPWLLLGGGAVLRMAVVLGILAMLARSGDWRILVAAAMGFALIRTVGVCTIAQRDASFQLASAPISPAETLRPRSKP
ncbi:N-ATPase subunit AtpR [Rhodopirellula sp. P2]|uniref:N-ATPase subunit AtpR n=1 Tax=Rhodopirellula sp. P2 TaxID=2127060 RepID=UPI002368C816|nr:ATP synthase subunit I [Rhodopirellula sp. P2]WDQ14909.1 ATP synthase subunit I [Rhodopirellula sp. P2]